LAHFTDLTTTFTAAGIGMILVAALTYRFKISGNETDEV